MDDREARERVARVEALLEEVEALDDPAAREKALEIVQALLDLYGEGLERFVAAVAARDDSGEVAGELAQDELVSHLLLLHDLHPVPLERRVRGALEEVRPYLDSHGGSVELVGVEGGIARLRLEGSCNGCPSSAVTLKLAIENAIHKAAPDVLEIEAEGAVDAAPAPQLIQLEVNGPPADEGPGGPADEDWAMVGALRELERPSGGPLIKGVAGASLAFLRIGEDLYAYRPSCPACGASLGDGELSGTEIECDGCRNRYDAVRAGRCLTDPDLHLDPVPLLIDEGLVKVALGVPA